MRRKVPAVTGLTHGNDEDIDALYGLEPVIDVSENSGAAGLDQFTDILCPYCAEVIMVRLDLSAGDHSYVEDCQVCCQAIEIGVHVTGDGSLEKVDVDRIDR